MLQIKPMNRQALNKKQSGYVALVAVMLIVVVSAIATMSTKMFISQSWSTGDHQGSSKAFFLAEAGVERGIRQWMLNNSYTGEGPVSLGAGTFTVNIYTTDFSGAPLAGNQRRVRGTGAVGANSRISEAIIQNGSTSTGFAVGDDGNTISWDGTSWSYQASSTSDNLYGVSCISASDCWSVGFGGRIIHWNGISWSNISSPTSDLLNEVDCISSSDCWAVGENGTIIHWNGTTWSMVSSPTSTELYDVSCVNGSDCWAVGRKESYELLLHWDGSNWTRQANSGSVPNTNFKGVSCLTTSNCWAVGTDEDDPIIQWDGSSWSSVTSPTVVDGLSGVDCIDSNNCWAVGPSEIFFRYQSGSWSEPSVSLPIVDYYDVACSSANVCFAVGEEDSSQVVIAKWDGSSWSRETVTSDPGKRLYSVDIISGLSGISRLSWREVFN